MCVSARTGQFESSPHSGRLVPMPDRANGQAMVKWIPKLRILQLKKEVLMSRAVLLVGVILLFASSASAIPVVDVLTGSDGNFSFSVVHNSSGGNDGQSGTVLDSISLGGAGGSATVTGAGTLLDLDVELVIGGGTYNAAGLFDLAGLLDDVLQQDVLLGTLELTYVSGADNSYDGLKFYLEDRNYSSATLKPNSLQGEFLSLWGATDFNPTFPGTPADPQIGDPLDLISGGTGIDLRLELAHPIPEPQAAMVFLTGLLTIQMMRVRRPRSA